MMIMHTVTETFNQGCLICLKLENTNDVNYTIIQIRLISINPYPSFRKHEKKNDKQPAVCSFDRTKQTTNQMLIIIIIISLAVKQINSNCNAS
ncbi:hypothetical protein T07_10400 [Trichinella nelsoni]|uniref:Uncharacterized protein n=1 Tax=Trichinella nelsoni TaxID=6336 RepID=A0A0V0RPQ6_9BILA|nr:hypothetical protein T07_10400 [Trichinella nelsoni]